MSRSTRLWLTPNLCAPKMSSRVSTWTFSGDGLMERWGDFLCQIGVRHQNVDRVGCDPGLQLIPGFTVVSVNRHEVFDVVSDPSLGPGY